MGKPSELIPGDGAAWVRIQYVKYRQVLRLTGAYDHGLEPIEIPVPALLARLGIDAPELDVPVRYLLFAGVHHRPRRGAAELVASFHSEAEARRAFTALRRQRSDREGWAELAALDRRGRCSRLAWFVQDDDVRRAAPGSRRPRPWRRS